MIRIPAKDIPQADNLTDVVRVVEAIATGAVTFQDIARSIEKVDRQGRYYRRAAEILGLVHNPAGANHSELTELGKTFARGDALARARLLPVAILQSKLIQRAIPFLESHGSVGITRQKFEEFIRDCTEPTGPTMIPRRTATVLHWLKEANLIRESGGRILLATIPDGLAYMEFTTDEEPLMPGRHALADYEEVARRVRTTGEEHSVLMNQVAHERANQAHEELTRLIARRIRRAGGLPRRNKLIDLAAKLHGREFIFEMKSTTDDNLHAQVRKGVSQLYEYRYLQAIPAAELVLVIEKKPSKKQLWLIDYLLKDRKISILWDGNDNLYCPATSSQQLSFLNPMTV